MFSASTFIISLNLLFFALFFFLFSFVVFCMFLLNIFYFFVIKIQLKKQRFNFRKKIILSVPESEGSPHSVVANALNCDIVVSSSSNRVITFTFGLMPPGKA